MTIPPRYARSGPFGLRQSRPDLMLVTFHEILAQQAHDGVTFDAETLRVDRIREGVEYGGLRLRVIASIHHRLCRAKGALRTYSKSISKELAPKGIRVNNVCPGWIMTEGAVDLVKGMQASNGGTYEEARQAVMAWIGGIPIGQGAEPEQVADLIAYLASPRSMAPSSSSMAARSGPYRVMYRRPRNGGRRWHPSPCPISSASRLLFHAAVFLTRLRRQSRRSTKPSSAPRR